MSVRTPERPASSGPERKPSEAGLRGGGLMRPGDAQPRRAARFMTIANDESFGARGLSPRAFRANAPYPTRAKAKLSLGY